MNGQSRHALTTDELDRELADALRVEPSVEFRASVHARLAGERIQPSWGRLAPAVVACAGLAAVLVGGAFWLNAIEPAPVTQAGGDRPGSPVAIVGRGVSASPGGPDKARPTSDLKPVAAMLRPTIARRAPAEPHQVPSPAVESTLPQTEVLLSDSEQAGLRLLFESVAAGRLELPESMLSEPTPPIVKAQRDAPVDPWTDGRAEGDVQ